MTVLVVVFCEILPKTVAINAPDRISLLVARPMQNVVNLLGPILYAIGHIVRWILARFGFVLGETAPLLHTRNFVERSIFCIVKVASKSTTATCSAACLICVTSRLVTS